MSSFKLEQFGGMLPAWDAHLLPAGQGSDSLNSYLFSGALTGWRVPKLLRALQNSAAKMVYRVPTVTQSSALAYLAFPANVNEGDTVKVSEEVYRFTATVSSPYDVLLGGSATASASNFLSALLNTGTSGVTYGSGTVANPAVSDTSCSQDVHNFGSGNVPFIKVVATTFGAAYNTTVIAESTSNARTTWLYDLNLSHTTTTLQGGTNQTFDNSITGAATWLEFVDQFTDVMRSPVVDDQFSRYYFASPSQPPKYNTYDRIQAGQSPWLLGVPAPGCDPGVSVTGGGNIATMGNTGTSGVDTPGANTIYLIPITPAGSMSLDEVFCLPQDTNAAAVFKAVLYDDNAGAPFELLNVGAEVVGCSAGSPIGSAFVNPTGLLANVKYWIGFMTDSAISIVTADTTTYGVKKANTYSNGAPSFITSPTTGQPNWQIYGNLTTSSVLEARSYVYTWVTAYGEEGPPSLPTLVNGWSNGTWTVTMFTPPPDDMGVVRNITKTRIYRTVTGISGGATFYFVAEQDVALSSYVDNSDDSVVALNTILPSALWFPPPEGLQGIRSMPNGMAVGFRGNELWFCEPYRPHAWPPGYVLTTEFPIVGIGVSGNAVVAATSGTPYVAQGVAPSQMVLTKAISPEPCHSRGSVLSTDIGVFYTSPNGLIMVTPSTGQAQNVTETWVTRERWRELTPQQNLSAIQLASTYFAFETGEQTGFTLELANDADSFTIWPQPGGHRVGFNRSSSPLSADIDNVLIDPWTGIGLLVASGNVYYYDFSDQVPTIQPYTWRSKIYQQPAKNNYEAMKIYFSVPPGTPTQNADRNEANTDDPSWDTLQTGQYGIVRVFADGQLVTVREIRKSGELLRILSGFKAEEWQWEFEARVLISNMQAATSAKELAGV